MVSVELGFFSKTLVVIYSNLKFQTYFGLIVYVVIALAICGLLAAIAYLLSLSSLQDSEKKSEYECGFEPFDSATRLPFDVHFYLVGILFLIFDVEIALLFPWVLSLNNCGWFGFYLMIGFILLLSVGFLYEWKRGALIWPSRQKENIYKIIAVFYEIDENTPIKNYEAQTHLLTSRPWLWELYVAAGFEQNVAAYLPEAALICFLLFAIISIALELDKKHVKKSLALETLAALKMSLIFVIILLSINAYFHSSGITENNYTAENLYIITIKLLITITVIFVFDNSKNYIEKHKKDLLEFPIVLGLSFFFMLMLIGTQNLISAFLCIVGFSLNLYVLILFDAPEAVAREAGIKYYYLSTFSSGLILYGTFLIFLTLKTLNFSEINQILHATEKTECSSLISVGIAMILLGTFFKLSAFPGHLWAAEVYEGSSNVIMGFFMLPVKIAALTFLIQFLTLAVEPLREAWQPLLIFASASSMLWGCFAAVFEKKTKRFLAYTSINQIGFLFIGIATASVEGYRATLIYLIIYTSMNIGFLTVFLNSVILKSRTLVYLTDFRGLGLENWLWGWMLAITMFSMAGIPPLAGFFGKFYLILHAQEQKLYVLVVIALITSLISAYYYLRIIKIIWFEDYTNVRSVICEFTKTQELFLYVTQAILFSFILASILVLEQTDLIVSSMLYETWTDFFEKFSARATYPRDRALECLMGGSDFLVYYNPKEWHEHKLEWANRINVAYEKHGINKITGWFDDDE